MLHASATLFFGVFATTTSLITAAEAYSRIEPTTETIDLILARRNKTTLVSKNLALVNISPEVWNLIKDQVIAFEIFNADRSLVNRTTCLDCEESITIYMGKRSGTREGPRLASREFWTSPSCKYCLDCVETFLMDSLSLESISTVRINAREEIVKSVEFYTRIGCLLIGFPICRI